MRALLKLICIALLLAFICCSQSYQNNRERDLYRVVDTSDVVIKFGYKAKGRDMVVLLREVDN